MKFTAVLSKFDTPLWSYHILVPDEVSKIFVEAGNKRVVCKLANAETFQCGLMPNGKGIYFININKEIRDKLGLRLGMHIEVELKKDESKYGLPMPEELEELLKQDETGSQLFHALTPGKQRNLIYIAGKPKRPETRLKKAIVVVEHLKANQGKIDFRRLNEDMKNANNL